MVFHMNKKIYEKEYFEKAYIGGYLKHNPPSKWEKIIKILLKYKSFCDILDVGCATGNFLKSTRLYFNRCCGIDISNYAIELANVDNDGIRFSRQDATNLDFNDDSFDVVTCLDTLEHIEDLNKALVEIKRVLKNDGIFLSIIPVYDSIGGMLVDLIDKDETHIWKESRKFWLDKIGKKFKILDWFGIYRILVFNKFPFHISRRFKNISPIIMVVASGMDL